MCTFHPGTVEVREIKLLLDRTNTALWSSGTHNAEQFLGKMHFEQLLPFVRPMVVFEPEDEGIAGRGRTVVLYTWNNVAWDTANEMLTDFQSRHRGKPGIHDRQVLIAEDAFTGTTTGASEGYRENWDWEFRGQSGSSAQGVYQGGGNGQGGLGAGMVQSDHEPGHQHHRQAPRQLQGRNMDASNSLPPAEFNPGYGTTFDDPRGGADMRYHGQFDNRGQGNWGGRGDGPGGSHSRWK